MQQSTYRLDICFYQCQLQHIPHHQIIHDISELRQMLSSFHVERQRIPFGWCIRLNLVFVPNFHIHLHYNHHQLPIENLPMKGKQISDCLLAYICGKLTTNQGIIWIYYGTERERKVKISIDEFLFFFFPNLRFYAVHLNVGCRLRDNIHIVHHLMFDRFLSNRCAKSYEQILHFRIQHKQNQL